MAIDDLKTLLDSFLNRWPVDSVEQLRLQEYVGVGDRDTFCQWVETRTRMLGSIKGLSSIKFGIYERKDPSRKPKNYQNDEKYSWLRSYGDNRQEAFENVKRDILRIIFLAERGNFHQIDNIPLPDLFKWKVAFLYSNERLVPIYKREVLNRIGKHYGLSLDNNTSISQIQNAMILNKPAHLDVYEFMQQLFERFGTAEDKNEIVGDLGASRRTTRRAATTRSTDTQLRKGTRSYFATQRHNKIQEALRNILVKKYGEDSVVLEENYVDIKVIQEDCLSFYEVKSSPYASHCVRDALGQILLYSSNDTDKRPKKHIVVGQYPATEQDKKYIDFLKQNLRLEFEYMSVSIE